MEVRVIFDAVSENESLARMITAAVCVRQNPTLEELSDVKTAVSEAVTNAIIHGYRNNRGSVELRFSINENQLEVVVKDEGVGIEDIAQAMEPMYTTRGNEERSGMGFSFMEAFMDTLFVESKVGVGTVVTMRKEFGKQHEHDGFA